MVENTEILNYAKPGPQKKVWIFPISLACILIQIPWWFFVLIAFGVNGHKNSLQNSIITAILGLPVIASVFFSVRGIRRAELYRWSTLAFILNFMAFFAGAIFIVFLIYFLYVMCTDPDSTWNL